MDKKNNEWCLEMDKKNNEWLSGNEKDSDSNILTSDIKDFNKKETPIRRLNDEMRVRDTTCNSCQHQAVCKHIEKYEKINKEISLIEGNRYLDTSFVLIDINCMFYIKKNTRENNVLNNVLDTCSGSNFQNYRKGGIHE